VAAELGGAGSEEKRSKEHKRKRAKWFLIVLSCPPNHPHNYLNTSSTE
jgi:hypothetical protein